MKFKVKSNNLTALQEAKEQFQLPVSKVLCPTTSLEHIKYDIIVDVTDYRLRVNACSDQYKLISISELTNLFEDFLRDHNIEFEAIYRISDYSSFYVSYILDYGQYNVDASKDTIFPMISFTHSYTGKIKFELKIGLFRLVCYNGMSVSHYSIANIEKKHTAELLYGIQEAIANLHDNLQAITDPIYKHINQLQSTTLSVIDIPKIVEDIAKAVGFNKNKIQDVINRIYFEHTDLVLNLTLWLVYNGFTYVLNHDTGKKPIPMEKARKLEIKLYDHFLTIVE